MGVAPGGLFVSLASVWVRFGGDTKANFSRHFSEFSNFTRTKSEFILEALRAHSFEGNEALASSILTESTGESILPVAPKAERIIRILLQNNAT